MLGLGTRTLASASLLVALASGQVVPFIGQQEANLTAPDAAWGDAFGISVSLSGDTAVVGAGLDDSATGSAHVFVRSGSGWTEQCVLTASDATVGDRFGYAVAVCGETVVVGAEVNGGSGAVYVFVRTGATWTEQAKLTASDAAAGDWFGHSVALDGDTLAVGAPYDDLGQGGLDRGSVYVFTRAGTAWGEQAKLTATPDAADADFFGGAVTISADTILAGANQAAAPSVPHSGAAYVFCRGGTTWNQQAKLTASDPETYAEFGSSVAVSGETALIGCVFDDHSGLVAPGSAYVFVRDGSTWSEQAKLTAAAEADYDYFGSSVSLVGDHAVIGARLHDGVGIDDAGSASVFVRNATTWAEETSLVAADAAPSDNFGCSLAIDGDAVLIGAYGGDAGPIDYAGSAYAFRLVTIGKWTDLGHGLTGTIGEPLLEGTGYLLPSSPMTLALTQAKPFCLAPLVVGVSALIAPFKGGVMVPHPDLVFPLFTNGLGTGSFGGLWPTGVPSGFDVYFQWWLQDPAGPQGFASSNALSATTP